jgi:hypothetical protein
MLFSKCKKLKKQTSFFVTIYKKLLNFKFYSTFECLVKKIRPDIQYPAFRFARYPAKSVSGASRIFWDQNRWFKKLPAPFVLKLSPGWKCPAVWTKVSEEVPLLLLPVQLVHVETWHRIQQNHLMNNWNTIILAFRAAFPKRNGDTGRLEKKLSKKIDNKNRITEIQKITVMK